MWILILGCRGLKARSLLKMPSPELKPKALKVCSKLFLEVVFEFQLGTTDSSFGSYTRCQGLVTVTFELILGTNIPSVTTASSAPPKIPVIL